MKAPLALASLLSVISCGPAPLPAEQTARGLRITALPVGMDPTALGVHLALMRVAQF